MENYKTMKKKYSYKRHMNKFYMLSKQKEA